MPTIYNARDAGNYERLMGRWSRRLAPLFIEHAGIAEGDKLLEVGCGTGSLTFALAEAGRFARLTAIDQSEVYLAAAQAKNRDPRIHLEQGDGCALRFINASSIAQYRCSCCPRWCRNQNRWLPKCAG